jgi:hypothetical protein
VITTGESKTPNYDPNRGHKGSPNIIFNVEKCKTKCLEGSQVLWVKVYGQNKKIIASNALAIH